MRAKLLLLTILLLQASLMYANRKAGKSDKEILHLDPDSTLELKTKTGKTITISESHPESLSTSMITVTPFDFTENLPIELEKTDPFERAELTDLDNDGFNEVFIITKSAGSGSSGKIYGFASDNDIRLVKIEIEPDSDESLEEGGQLEGYMGHDVFHFENNMLVREFPVYKITDPNVTPTGGTKKVYYRYHDFKLETVKVEKKE